MIQNRVCLCFLTSSIYHLAYQTNNLKNIESPINLWLNICKNLQVYRMQCDDVYIYIYSDVPIYISSGQIIATSHDLTRPHPKWWFSKGNPLISEKSRLVKYYNLGRYHLMSLFYQEMTWTTRQRKSVSVVSSKRLFMAFSAKITPQELPRKFAVMNSNSKKGVRIG